MAGNHKDDRQQRWKFLTGDHFPKLDRFGTIFMWIYCSKLSTPAWKPCCQLEWIPNNAHCYQVYLWSPCGWANLVNLVRIALPLDVAMGWQIDIIKLAQVNPILVFKKLEPVVRKFLLGMSIQDMQKLQHKCGWVSDSQDALWAQRFSFFFKWQMQSLAGCAAIFLLTKDEMGVPSSTINPMVLSSSFLVMSAFAFAVAELWWKWVFWNSHLLSQSNHLDSLLTSAWGEAAREKLETMDINNYHDCHSFCCW